MASGGNSESTQGSRGNRFIGLEDFSVYRRRLIREVSGNSIPSRKLSGRVVEAPSFAFLKKMRTEGLWFFVFYHEFGIDRSSEQLSELPTVSRLRVNYLLVNLHSSSWSTEFFGVPASRYNAEAVKPFSLLESRVSQRRRSTESERVKGKARAIAAILLPFCWHLAFGMQP